MCAKGGDRKASTKAGVAGYMGRRSQLANVHLRALRFGEQPSLEPLNSRALPTVARESSKERRLAVRQGFEACDHRF